MNASVGMDLIRSFFSSIDTAIYSLISRKKEKYKTER